MEYDDYSREIDADLMNDYIQEGYRIYMKSDKLDPLTIGQAIWQAYYEYENWDGDPEEDKINIFDVEFNIDYYLDIVSQY
jgi:hypothetical protein